MTEELLHEVLSRLRRIEELLGASPTHLTAREAAAYLSISYSTFRKKARSIKRQPSTGKYRREDLDEYAASLRPRKKR